MTSEQTGKNVFSVIYDLLVYIENEQYKKNLWDTYLEYFLDDMTFWSIMANLTRWTVVKVFSLDLPVSTVSLVSFPNRVVFFKIWKPFVASIKISSSDGTNNYILKCSCSVHGKTFISCVAISLTLLHYLLWSVSFPYWWDFKKLSTRDGNTVFIYSFKLLNKIRFL